MGIAEELAAERAAMAALEGDGKSPVGMAGAAAPAIPEKRERRASGAQMTAEKRRASVLGSVNAANTVSAPEADMGSGRWDEDVLQCISDGQCLSSAERREEAICACVCPCLVFGKIANVIHESYKEPIAPMGDMSNGILWENCCLHCCAFGPAAIMLTTPFSAMAPFINCSGCFAMWMRANIREKYGIEGAMSGDCLAHLVTYPCALVQEYRQLKKHVPVPPGFKWYKKEILGEPTNKPDDL